MSFSKITKKIILSLIILIIGFILGVNCKNFFVREDYNSNLKIEDVCNILCFLLENEKFDIMFDRFFSKDFPNEKDKFTKMLESFSIMKKLNEKGEIKFEYEIKHFEDSFEVYEVKFLIKGFENKYFFNFYIRKGKIIQVI